MSALDEIYKLKELEFDAEVKFFFSESTVARRMKGAKGAVVSMHVHPCKGHLAILAKGRARLIRDDVATDHEAGDCMEIKKGERHGILFLEDSIWFCIDAEE